MYKRNQQGWLKHMDFILWDVFVLQVSFVLGYMIRHGWGLPYVRQDYRILAVLLAVFDVLVAVLFNTMHNVMKRNYMKELWETFRHVIYVLLIMSLYLFSTQAGDTYSRITIYLTAAFHFVLGYGVRVAWKPIVRKINKGKNKGTMILVADEADISDILHQASGLDDFEYAGLVLSDRNGTGETLCGVSVVSDLAGAADYICQEWVDEVFVYSENRPGVDELIEKCREMAVPVHLRLPVAEAGKSIVEKVGGYSVLTLASNYVEPAQQLLKRIMDILGGLFGSLVALIILAFVGPKIRKESPGPILFTQVRVGKNGKRFKMYKIRSMYMDAEERKSELLEKNRVSDGMMFKMDFDPRIIGNKVVDGKHVTGIGEKLRRSSLDEFPQFFNVLKGEMSLVGTRPPTEDEWEKYKYHHRARLATKPGMTGMWQVSGRSEITDFEEVVKLDTEYINNWSIGLDCKILLKTIRTVWKKNGAM